MAKQTGIVNYRDLTVALLKEKYAFLFLGLTTFAAVFLTVGYAYLMYSNNYASKQSAQSAVAKPATKFPTTYKVVEGDALATISTKMYGSDVYVEDLMKANNLYTPESLEVGSTITIPAVSPKPTPQGEIGVGAMTTGPVTFQGTTYKVQAGESLSDIAIKIYGDPNAWIRIAQENGITNPDVVVEGMTLRIPKS